MASSPNPNSFQPFKAFAFAMTQTDADDQGVEDVLIIGAGVIGLAIGWRLARQGVRCLILERAGAGLEASWAGAGMLAPVAELHFQEEGHLTLGQQSLALYPQFLADLHKETGVQVEYGATGSLAVALNADHRAWLERMYQHQQALGLPVRWLTGQEAQALEPALAAQVVVGVLCPQDHYVNNRELVQTLQTAFLKAGGRLLENQPVVRFACAESPAKVVTEASVYRAEKVVLAAGSWSGMVEGLPNGQRVPVRPVKGQILSITAPNHFKHIIRTPNAYLVPRQSGHLIVGATEEEMGFDKTQTVGGMLQLLGAAWQVSPSLYELPIANMWCGLRPGSRDNAPILGQSNVLQGLFFATGHYRNGLLNTPATAMAMEALLRGQTPPPWLKNFLPTRFGL